jgi:hypothetical protein
MAWECDLDNLAMAAKERHAALVADGMRQHAMSQAVQHRGQKGTAWQWLRRTVLHEAPAQQPQAPAVRQHAARQA